MQVEFITTQDGSHSLVSNQFGVTYHSRYGAIQESMHVFIRHGLNALLPSHPEIAILEIGFGTGLNALLTLRETTQHPVSVRYEAVEPFPVSVEDALSLNYTRQPGLGTFQEAFEQFHTCAWEKEVSVTPSFSFTKHPYKLEEMHFEPRFHLVYFDAFAPGAQPELWTAETLEIVYQALKTNGILVTYCAKGAVKRSLKEIGFQVETLQGPPGKREMIRCRKIG